MNRFGDTQAGGIAGRQNGVMLPVTNAAEKLENLLRAQNDGQCLWFFRRRNDITENPVPAERNFIEETQCCNRDEDRTGRQLLLVGQVNLVVADMLGTQQFRGFFEMACEQGDLLQIRGLRIQGEIPHLHVFRHALSKRSHGGLLCEWNCCTAAPPYFRRRKLTNPADGTAYGLKAVPPITA